MKVVFLGFQNRIVARTSPFYPTANKDKKYKEQIIRARITGDINSLLEVVGKDNFEELNDCINVVDYFIYEKGLSKILEKRANNDRKEKEKDIESTEEEVIEEYEKQLQRLDRIYISMEENLKSNNQER